MASSASALSMAGAIRKVLGLPGETLPEFSKQFKVLSKDEQAELARGCAAYLGLTQEEVKFPLQ